ncbi:MAG: hypothetical protein K9M49_06805 [Candidatus Marinimicrobia bacterium]|nr:hypothetical protein [Candidatus Neomarinimicrobiota bacterium]MCF7850091.1 hypothetical protein [Candidatus Neomarinimicrobiota bacterium]MCF7904848.1 hypothetical protein [Candidatus Neomarinimicrobiota bacterium]
MTRISIATKIRLTFLIAVLFSFHACDLMEEPNLPTWTNTVEFPLVTESVTLESLEDEDNISSQLYDSTGTRRIFAYSDTSTMDTQSVGDQLIFDDITQAFSQSAEDVTVTGSTINQSSGFDPIGVDPINKNIVSALGPIELSDIPPSSTDPIALNEIYPAINSVPDGNEVVPGGDLDTVRTEFTFDDFQSATFLGGSLDVNIINNMVIYLGNDINIQLQEVIGVDTVDIAGAALQWTTPVAPSTNAIQTLDLTGLTLPGTIIIQISGQTIGSDGQAIQIDNTARNSSFVIDISGSNLQVSEANAQVPSQTVDESGTITMAASSNKVEEALISEGNLSITVDNQMAVDSKLVISIPSLVDGGGVTFLDSMDLAASVQSSQTFPIDGYSMVMDINNQVVEYTYQVKTIDTGSNYVTLSQTDQVDVTIAMHGNAPADQIVFSQITGQIEPQSITDNGDIDVSSDSKILTADISAGSIAINIDNRINETGTSAGLPEITLTINELLDGSSNPLTDTMVLQPNPTSNTMNFDLSDYTLTFPDTATQVLTYTTHVTTPSGETGTYKLEDSILVDINVADMEFSSVTGFFSQDAMVDSNEIVLTEGTKLLEAVFETGDLQLTMTNNIGVVADVEFKIDEFKHKLTDQSLSTAFVLQDITTPQVSNIDLSDYNLVFDTATPGVDQAIHYTSSVALPDDQEMTLTFGDSIAIDVNITNLAMASVTGIIEPDTLTIEESEQEIALPDMVADLKFEKVNIDIDFNSSFEIPIELSLFLSATNEDGVSETIDTTFSLTAQDDRVSIDAAPLLNIHPEAIVSSGMAVVGDGVSSSTIAKGQMMAPVMYINVPLSLIIENPPSLASDAEGVDSPLPDDQTISLEEVTIFAEAVNYFEFGASVIVLASNDSTDLDSVRLAQGMAHPDTLFTLEILPKENVGIMGEPEINEIMLSSDKMSIIEERFFIKPQIYLLGQGSEPARMFTTDSLTLKSWGRVSYTVHGDQLLEKETSQ